MHRNGQISNFAVKFDLKFEFSVLDFYSIFFLQLEQFSGIFSQLSTAHAHKHP